MEAYIGESKKFISFALNCDNCFLTSSVSGSLALPKIWRFLGSSLLLLQLSTGIDDDVVKLTFTDSFR